MPQKWSELSQSDEFKALPPEEQEKSRAGFFEQRIAPYADPERVPGLRKEWDARTRLPRPAAPAVNVAQPDANVAERQALARPASAQDAAPRTQNRTTLPTTASQGGQALQRPGRPQPTTQNRTGIDRVTGGSWDALKSGAQTTMANIGLTLDAWKGDTQSAMAGAMDARDIAKTPEQRAFTEALAGREETDSIWGEIKNVGAAAIEEPVGALHEVVAQTPNSGTAMAGMYAGAKMGRKILSPLGKRGEVLGAFVGGVAGAMFGTSLVETGAITQDKAADGQLTEQEFSEATRQGATKSAVIGTIDRLTMGVTGFMFSRAGRQATEAATEALARQGVDVTSEEAVQRALSDPATAQMLKSVITSTAQKANTAGRRLGRGAAGMALESTSEGLGEYFGSSLAGLDPSVREAVLEGLLSMPQSTLELLWSRGEAQTGTPYDQTIADQERMQPGATPGNQGTPPPAASDEPTTEPTPTAGGPAGSAGVAPPGDDRPLGRVSRTGVDQLIDIARKMGFDEEATRLGTFKKVSALADRLYEEGNVDAAMRLHERAERIHRDIMGEDSSLIQEAERAGQQLPAVYTYEGAVEGTTDLATAGPGQQQAPIEGELYEEPGRLPAPPKRLTTDGVIYAGDGRGVTTPPADQPGDAPSSRLQRPGRPAPAAPTWADPAPAEPATPEEPRPVLQNRNRSSQASIEQMASIAANPDYTRLGFSRDFANGAPVVEPGAQIRPEQLGREDVAATAGGRRIPVQYAVVEADQLLPSNRWDGSRVPEYEQGLDGASRAIAGNGRVAGLQRAYEDGNAEGYREGIVTDAALHGIPEEVVRGMQRPVLVRLMPREEITDNIGDESNTTGTAALSPGEQARNDTRRVDVAAVELDDNGEPTQTAVEQFIATMPAAERAGLMDGKRPNRQAYDRLSNAVFANAYESDELLRLAAEATDPEVRTIMAGLKIAAGKMSRLKGAGSYDIRGLVVEAAEAAINAKRAGESLREFITQGDMGRNPAVVPILEMMADNIRSAKRIGENLSALADVFYAEANLPAEDMFGAVQKRAPGQLLDEFYDTNTQAGQPAPGGSQNPESPGEPRGPEPAPGGDEGQAVAPVEGSADQPQAESESGQPQEVTPEGQTGPADNDNPGGEDSPPGEFTLSGETEAEREAREKAEREAREAEENARREAEEKARKEKEAQDDKARADETVDNFELGQSAEQQLSGQAGMFDAPTDPVAAAAADAATSPTNDTPAPTEGQIEAGNYKKGHVRWNGLDITIENPAGTRRRPAWPELNGHYGYIKATEGADGEHVDVFLNPDENRTDKVVVIDQYNGGKKSGGFDEHKVMLGYPNKMAAINAYKANYTRGWQVGPATEMGIDEFKAWLQADTTQPVAKPASDQRFNFSAVVRNKAGEPFHVNSRRGNRASLAPFENGRPDIHNMNPTVDLDGYTFSDEWWSDGQIVQGRTEGQEPAPAEATPVAEQVEASEHKPADPLQDKLDDIDAEIDAAAAELADLLKPKPGTLNTGVDPQILVVGAKLGALYVQKGVVKFAQWSRAIVAKLRDLGVDSDQIMPYLKEIYAATQQRVDDEQFDQMDDARTVRRADLDTILADQESKAESNNAERTPGDPAADRGNRENEVQPAAEDLQDGGRGRRGSGADGTGRAAGGQGSQAGQSVDNRGTAADRERSDQLFRDEKSRLEDGAARDTDDSGSRPDSTGGLFTERTADGGADRLVASTPRVIPKPGLQEAESKPADLEQIKAQMPFLTAGQAEDVAFAERRLAKTDGFGVLFTNGTGTGKTFTGLGILKRMLATGKRRILIGVPKQPIADAWVNAARDFFGIKINKLSSTSDAGKGVVVTTYANMGDNTALAKENWDAFFMDEAHYLASNQQGDATKALAMLNALGRKTDAAGDLARLRNYELFARIEELNKRATSLRRQDNDNTRAEESEIEKELERLYQQRNEALEAAKEEVASIADEEKPRSVFLSATPFAYEKNVGWAQEWLFDWNPPGTDESSEFRGYNSGSNFDRFMMTHFGYRMRYNKLTEPDSKVDRGLMQRAFNTWLRKEGVLSARALDSDFDYDRRFVMAESAIGRRVDAALEWLREKSSGDDEIAGMNEIREKVAEQFDYHSRMYFLEAIKARESLGHIRAHLALGRKVLVVHDFKKGGTANPFKMEISVESENAEEVRAAYEAFRAEFKDLIEAFSSLPSPIDQLSRAFPEALIYNGDVTAKNRIKLQDRFNSDAPGSPQLMIAQSDAMREGVSIHDTSGKHPRVEINLGMPGKPTAAIQLEGRIYRTGQASNAMFRYFTIGTNWERYAFASKIAGRTSAAENLAMGEEARGLKEAFINAYEEADVWEPGYEGEGSGGKETDKAYTSALTPWDMAKSFYFGTKKQGRGRAARGREGKDYFATPEPVGLKMVQMADLRGGESALEPSAGHGAIARWFPENTTNRAIEFEDGLASKTALHFDGQVQTGDFMQHNVVNKYDAIVMNPPFGQGGAQARDHVAKAIKHLRDGGRIVALVPTGPAADAKFEKLLYSDAAKDIYLAGEIRLPAVTFERAGTGVMTRILVLEKQTDPDLVAQIQQQNRDYTNADDISELFDRMESLELRPRSQPAEPAESESQAPEAGEIETWTAEHTKTGDTLYMAKPTRRLEREEYKQVAALAKEKGGYWSRFGKAGFLFKSEEARSEFVAELGGSASEPDGSAPAFSRSILADALMGVDEASRDALEIHRRLGLNRAGVGLEVVATEAGLPDVIRRQAQEDGATGQIEGVFHNKTVYVVASSVRSGAHLEEIIAHEGLGHFGGRKLFGKDIAKHYDQLFFQLGGAKGMRSRLEARGIDFSEYLKTAERMGSKDQAFYLTDEFLAHIQQAQAIETLPEKIRRQVRELYGAIRDWMRKMKMANLADLNDADLALLLRRMRQSATSKQEAGSSRPAMIRASGGARFSRARHPFTLSGSNPSDSSQTGVTAQSLLARHWDGEPASSAQAAIREALRTKQPDVVDWLRVNRNRIQVAGAGRGDVVFSRAGSDTSRMRPAADGIVPGHTPEADPKQAEAPLEGGSVGADADWVLPGDTKMSAFTDKWLYRLQNKQVDLKRVQQAIRATGREINEAHDAYLKEELFHGRSAARVNEFLESELEPLIADMAARGVTQEELGRYLWARHAKEANARIADINPEYPDGGSGMTDAEADAYMADLSPEQQANFEALAARVDAMVQKTRDDLVNDELISAQDRETWESTYQFYVPLFRENEAADDGDLLTHGMGTGQGYSIKGAETKRRTGSALPVADILGNIANARDRAIVRGEKARVGRALYALALTNKNPDFWQTTSQAPLIKTHDKDGNVIEVADPLFKQRDNVVVVKLKTAKGNVVERAVVFSKRNERAMRMAHAVKNLDGQQLGELLGTTASVTRYFAQINTQYNPIFGVVNLVRDTQAALVNLSSTPLTGRQGAVASNMASIIGGALKNGGRRFSDDWMALAKEFEEAGGKTGYRDMFASARERTEDIQKALDPEWWTKRPWGKALTANGYLKDPAVLLVDKGVKPVFDWLSDYNDTLENATRLAVYKEARDQGLSMEASASIAKNITTNFNRKGELALQAGALFAFFNAAVQGTARVFETVAAPAGKRILAGGIMVGVMQGVMMALAGYDDDEPPQFVRERNLIFPIPGTDGKYLSLAMPLGFHVLPNLGRLMVETVRGGRPAEKIGGMMAVLADAFNPLGGSAPMAQILAPTAADPFVALSMNEDWTGKPIAREDFSSLNPTPGFTRSRDLASAPAVALAKLLNAVTGGTDYRQGLASPTGDQIDYLVGQLTGGIGREAIKTATTVTSMFTADELPAYKIPLLGRFYGETTGQASEASRFYSNIKRLNEHQNTVKGLRGDRKGNEAMRYLIENPEARLFDQGNRAYQQVQKLRRQRSELADRGASKARLKQIDQQVTRAMAQLNERMAASG